MSTLVKKPSERNALSVISAVLFIISAGVALMHVITNISHIVTFVKYFFEYEDLFYLAVSIRQVINEFVLIAQTVILIVCAIMLIVGKKNIPTVASFAAYVLCALVNTLTYFLYLIVGVVITNESIVSFLKDLFSLQGILNLLLNIIYPSILILIIIIMILSISKKTSKKMPLVKYLTFLSIAMFAMNLLITFFANINIEYIIRYGGHFATQFITTMISLVSSLPLIGAIITMTLWFAFPSKKALENTEQESPLNMQPIEEFPADAIVKQASEEPTAKLDSDV